MRNGLTRMILRLITLSLIFSLCQCIAIGVSRTTQASKINFDSNARAIVLAHKDQTSVDKHYREFLIRTYNDSWSLSTAGPFCLFPYAIPLPYPHRVKTVIVYEGEAIVGVFTDAKATSSHGIGFAPFGSLGGAKGLFSFSDWLAEDDPIERIDRCNSKSEDVLVISKESVTLNGSKIKSRSSFELTRSLGSFRVCPSIIALTVGEVRFTAPFVAEQILPKLESISTQSNYTPAGKNGKPPFPEIDYAQFLIGHSKIKLHMTPSGHIDSLNVSYQ